jgi:hypothetical protein
MSQTRDPQAAFYCVADERYFLGAVGMINSLRLQGHDEPIFLLDCGLTAAQRELLGAHATLVRAPAQAPPYLLKTIAPLSNPAEVMVLIDADMIVTKPLGALMERAVAGRVVAFENDRDRFVPEWGELLELGPIRRRPYVSSGLLLLGGTAGREVLELLHDRQSAVEFGRTYYGENDAGYPFLYPEQDVLNAILCTRAEPDRLLAVDHRLAPTPPFPGLRLRHVEELRCAYPDGIQPYVLHHFHRKPWLDPIYHGIYSRLLARLLLGEELAVAVPEHQVPLRMRSGAIARLERARVDAGDVFGRYVRDPVRRWIGNRTGDSARRAVTPKR